MSFIPVLPATSLPGTGQSFYQDDPPASGTYAQSFPVPPYLGVPLFRLSYLAVRWDLPFGIGESATIRLYRYRKTAPFGVFTYTQMTATFVANSTSDWGWTYDISGNILAGFQLNPTTDSIAVSNVYVAGGAPNVRALRVDFALSEY
jgi:hypothetical protein